MSKHVLDIDEVTKFLRQSPPDSKIYLGADSSRFKRNGIWMAEFCICVCVHKSGRSGCKIFGEVVVERDYDQNRSRPSMRLMREATLLAETFHKLEHVLKDFYVELHIDMNPDKAHGSSCVVDQALGFLRSSCDVDVVASKPTEFSASASFAADRLVSILDDQRMAVA